MKAEIIFFFFKERITLKHSRNSQVLRPKSPPLNFFFLANNIVKNKFGSSANFASILKELQNYNCKFFLCPSQNRRKHNQDFKLLFFTINLQFGKFRLTIYICKTEFSSHKQHLFGLLFPRNANKTHRDQSQKTDLKKKRLTNL